MSTSSEVNIKWHFAFYCALECVLRKNKAQLEFYKEYSLSKEPLRIDMLLVEKCSDIKIEDESGRIFRKYNIIEYKSPRNGLNINNFYKTIGYAALYKGLAAKISERPVSEITVSFFREKRPKKLFRMLKGLGFTIKQMYQGIYYVYGDTLFPVQIVVTGETDSSNQVAYRLLSKNVNKEDVRKFLNFINRPEGAAEKSNADVILQASISANREIYEELRREDPMCEALRELMKEDIEAAEAKGRAEEREANTASIAENLIKNGVLADIIKRSTGLPMEKLQQIADRIGVKLVMN